MSRPPRPLSLVAPFVNLDRVMHRLHGRHELLRALCALAASCVLCSVPTESAAVWSPRGIQLSDASTSQLEPSLASDGRGGVIVAWPENRQDRLEYNLYAQRFTPFGDLASGWPTNGTRVCGARLDQLQPQAVAVSEGSPIVAWTDRRNGLGAIYAQRLDRNGAIEAGWPIDGIPVWTRGYNWGPSVISDRAGGAFVSWLDITGEPRAVVRLQHLTGSGRVTSGWPDTGIVMAVSEDNLIARACEDGHGGVLVTWQTWASPKLFCLRISGTGAIAPGWPAQGVLVSGTPGGFGPGAILPSGDGGALIAWQDTRSDAGDIYATRLTGSGTPAAGWPAGGLAVGAASRGQVEPFACSDGSGGIVVAWQDDRSANWDIYANRITAVGVRAPGWPAEGAPVCVAQGNQINPKLVTDGAGGAVIVWSDYRDAPAFRLASPYVQRIRGDGRISEGWPADGEALHTGPVNAVPSPPVSDGESGAYVAWYEFDPSRANQRVYIQRVGAGGTLAPAPLASDWLLYRPRPNPAVASVSLGFVLRRETLTSVTIVDLRGSIVRRLVGAGLQEAGTHWVTWDGRNDDGRRAAPGIYFARFTAGDSGRSERFVMLR